MRALFSYMRFLLGCICAILFFVPHAHAFDFQPQSAEFNPVSPGSIVEQKVVLHRDPEESEMTANISLALHGVIEDWITLSHPENISFKKGAEKFDLNLVAHIPHDTVPGIYQVDLVTSFGEVAYQMPIVFTVSNQTKSDWNVQDVHIPSIERLQVLKLHLIVKNNGSDNIRPKEVRVQVYEKDAENFLDEFFFSGSQMSNHVPPYDAQEYVFDIPYQFFEGHYWAIVQTFDAMNQMVDEQGLEFDVIEFGGVNKPGRMSNVRFYPLNARARDVVEITADFSNTGGINMPANLIAEFSRNGNLVEIVSGPEVWIAAGEREELEVEFVPPEVGEYDVKVYASYDYRVTPEQSFTYQVTGLLWRHVFAFALTIALIILSFIYLQTKNKRVLSV